MISVYNMLHNRAGFALRAGTANAVYISSYTANRKSSVLHKKPKKTKQNPTKPKPNKKLTGLKAFIQEVIEKKKNPHLQNLTAAKLLVLGHFYDFRKHIYDCCIS